MRVLWIVNMVMPELAQHLRVKTGYSGTWLVDISRMLAESGKVELAIACVFGREYRKVLLNGITFYLLPGTGRDMLFYRRRFEPLWRRIAQDFKPDFVHLHGTEYSHGLAFLRACPAYKSVVSIQGVLNRIKTVDFAGISWWNLLRFRTLRENLHFNGMLELHWLHCRNAGCEREIFQRAQYANGTNTWDTVWAKTLNPKLRCRRIEYNLRPEFYSSPGWNYSLCEKYSVFTNPASVPLKGVHVLLEAVAQLQHQYPEVKVYVPGNLPKSGYGKYLSYQIRRLGLTESIVFCGGLNGAQMVERMCRAHAVVVPSAIESSSMILREAMLLGVPCIAACRGALVDFISDKADGYIYDYPEYPFLAERLGRLFASPELCRNFSVRARQMAMERLSRQRNYSDYLDFYSEIQKDVANQPVLPA